MPVTLRTRQTKPGETPTWPASDVICKRCFLVASGLDTGEGLKDDCGANLSAPSTGPLLSILPGGPTSGQVATGALTAAGGQTVSCSRSASAYCMGNDGLLHLLGPNTVRVEPTGLLIEPASVNSYPNSSLIDGSTGWNTSGWNSVYTLVTAPDGTNTAQLFNSGAGGASSWYLLAFPTMPTGPATVSIYGKAGTMNFVAINIFGGGAGGQQAAFDVNAGVVSLLSAGATAEMEALPNGWWKCSLSYTGAGNETAPIIGLGDTDAHAMASATAGTATLPASATIAVWQPQCENLGFATSPIVSTGSGATRDADVITVPNPLHPSNPGTWSVALKATPLDSWATVQPATMLALGTAGDANTATLQATSGTDAEFDVLDASSGDRSVAISGALSGSAVASLKGVSTAGVLSTTPAGGAPSGAGLGTIATQPASVVLGGAFAGWLTDIAVDV
jgi:hypothetical protein